MIQSGSATSGTPIFDIIFQDSFTYQPNVVLAVIGDAIGTTCQLSVVTVTGFTARCDNTIGEWLTVLQWIAIGPPS
jgi:hypothetical protein